MKTLSIFCNLVLFIFSLFLVLSEGPSQGTGYIILAVLLLLVPMLTIAVILLNRPAIGFKKKKETVSGPEEIRNSFTISLVPDITVIICNLALLGFALWALISQYPHPEEPGVNLFTVLV
jgi:hypothetical protein